MENLSALKYEFTIRKAHQVGRLGVIGADADVFISFEKSYDEFKSYERNDDNDPEQNERSRLQCAINYGIKLGKISAYLDIAIKHVMDNQKPKLNEKHLNDLRNLRLQLDEPSGEVICRVVVPEFQDLMKDIGVQL